MRLKTLVRSNSYGGRVNGRKRVILGSSWRTQRGHQGTGPGLGEGLPGLYSRGSRATQETQGTGAKH